MDFDFYAGGIEDAILAALRTGMPLVRSFETYSGQLDTENLKAALAAKTPTFPLIMASYADGVDVRMPATSGVLGRSLHFRHDCSFAVICASNDPRSEDKRRRGPMGAYEMMGQVRKTLTGLRLSKMVDAEKHLLTSEPLLPVANEFVAKMPNITAYAVIFETAFNWSSEDRTAAGTAVSELVLGVESLNEEGGPQVDNLPGVEFEV